MKNGDFEFLLGSPFELEKLVCEIYYKEEIVAEISQETEELKIEMYPPQTGKWWAFPLIQFQIVLEQARGYLLDKQGKSLRGCKKHLSKIYQKNITC